jgi:hypothetical protein
MNWELPEQCDRIDVADVIKMFVLFFSVSSSSFAPLRHSTFLPDVASYQRFS